MNGDADSIRSSAGKWSSFGAAASTAAGDIRRIDSGDFKGDEAQTYRDRLNTDLPPHLDTTSQAWSMVATALTTYSQALESLQSRMKVLASRAADQQTAVNSAGSAVADAKTADAHHTAAQEAAAKALKPGQALPTDTYSAQTSGAANGLSSANGALQSTITAANTLRSEHIAAVDACVTAIHQAKGLRFEEPPGFWGRLKNSATGWISEHADVLKSISGALKTISGIAGLLAMIPVLAPVMGPIALVAGGGALLIDATVTLTTGKGSWGDLLLDGATMLPLGKGLALLKGTRAGSCVVKVASKAGNMLRDTKVAGNAHYALSAVKNRTAYEGGRFMAGTKNVLSRVEVEVPLGNRALATSAGNLPMTGKINVPAVFTSRAAAKFREGVDNKVYEIKVNGAKYPESARHVEEAQKGTIWSGNTSVDGPERSNVVT
ncbi:MAG: hypothetical protein M3Y35_05650, partial [Actinomycetota bacterium]|nr:hypothetical protein [Actinomycetota bacterium]